MLKIWQRSDIDMHKICQFYAKYMTNVCLRYAQDTQKILQQQQKIKIVPMYYQYRQKEFSRYRKGDTP